MPLAPAARRISSWHPHQQELTLPISYSTSSNPFYSAHLRSRWRDPPIARDPLSALSLAANIFQVVGFTIQLAQLGKRIHDKGTTVRYDELETICKDFEDAKKTLDARLSRVAPTTEEEKQVNALAVQTSVLATKLEKQLAKLKKNASKSKSEAVRKAFKAVWTRSDILETEKSFVKFRDELTFRLVVLLNGKVDAEAIKQSADFKSLDDATKQITNALFTLQNAAEGRASQILQNQSRSEQSAARRHQELLQLIQTAMPNQSLDPNRVQISGTQQSKTRKEAIEAAIISSLWFPSIQDREDAIKENHSDTFAWIWKDPRSTQKPWADFRAFLRGDTGAYWITGKAGSGKSTLMKYINNSEELDQELDFWRQDKPLIYLSFYFWYNGTPEQKSERGVLLSLLHQILGARKELIHIAFKERVRAMEVNPDPPSPFHLETPELRRVIFAILKHLRDTKFFISVDGLDEYSRDRGSFTDVAQFFLSFLQLQNVKLLVSSRPEREFEIEFETLPRLRLHDLTLPDIQKYAHEKLLQHSRLQDLQLRDLARCEKLLAELVEASAGVFLWVYVVVKSLLIGLNNGESFNDLEAELLRLPTELDDLYEKILARVPAKYKAKMALMMDIVRVGTENGCILSALGLSWALDAQGDVLRNTHPFTTDEIVRRYNTLLAQTQSHTLGLIEIRENNGIGQGHDRLKWYIRVSDVMDNWILPDGHQARAASIVTFLHRSVSEFMMKGNSYLDFVKDVHLDEVQPALLLLQSAIANTKAQLSLIERKEAAEFGAYMNEPGHRIVYCALHWARSAGDRGNVFVEELDAVMSNAMHHVTTQEPITLSKIRAIRHWTHFMPEYCCHGSPIGGCRQLDAYDGRDIDQFVIYAVRHGLESFSRTRIERMIKLSKKDKGYLLFSALSPGKVQAKLHYKLPLWPGIVESLLNAGANPNETILITGFPPTEPETHWQLFLSELVTYMDFLPNLETTKYLIKNGADPNVVIEYTTERKSTEKFHRRSVLRLFKLHLKSIEERSEERSWPYTHISIEEAFEATKQIITQLEARSAVEQEWEGDVVIIDTSKSTAISAAQKFLSLLRQSWF